MWTKVYRTRYVLFREGLMHSVSASKLIYPFYHHPFLEIFNYLSLSEPLFVAARYHPVQFIVGTPCSEQEGKNKNNTRQMIFFLCGWLSCGHLDRWKREKRTMRWRWMINDVSVEKDGFNYYFVIFPFFTDAAWKICGKLIFFFYLRTSVCYLHAYV